METAVDKISKILRCDKDFLRKVESRLSLVTGKSGVLEKIAGENEKNILDRLGQLGVSNEASAREVYDALISKIESDDNEIFQALNRPSCDLHIDCEQILGYVKKVSELHKNKNRGLFLKREKAIEFLENQPPQDVLKYLGYSSVREMLEKEDLYEIFSSLRFIENAEWMNSVFFKQYEKLIPEDFEERDIEIRVLSKKWDKAADLFVKKKWHNISHLKEMGVVFVIPISLGISGELLRMLSLIFHYLNEIPFYSDIAKELMKNKDAFAKNYISLLRGDVFDASFPNLPASEEKSLWLVVQRYLAKDDENDWRLFVPRLNPEALHWQKASLDLTMLADMIDGFEKEIKFWENLDWVGNYFKDEIGNSVLVSFNLVDTVMSLVKEKELIKYLYHHQEALWNKIFSEYLGIEELERYMKEYLLKGYFEI